MEKECSESSGGSESLITLYCPTMACLFSRALPCAPLYLVHRLKAIQPSKFCLLTVAPRTLCPAGRVGRVGQSDADGTRLLGLPERYIAARHHTHHRPQHGRRQRWVERQYPIPRDGLATTKRARKLLFSGGGWRTWVRGKKEGCCLFSPTWFAAPHTGVAAARLHPGRPLLRARPAASYSLRRHHDTTGSACRGREMGG